MKKVLKEQKVVKKTCILKTENSQKNQHPTEKKILVKTIMPLCIVVQLKNVCKMVPTHFEPQEFN